MKYRIEKVNSISAYDKLTGDKMFSITADKCPLFEFCNCKTAACRVQLPDESCYWYRYFKNLIALRG
jgi:hypothetical protein